jgi:hypothetical protein
MNQKHQEIRPTLALLWRGDPTTAGLPTPQNRLYPLFRAFADLNVRAESAPFSDEMVSQIRDRLIQFDGILVWVDPISDGHDRSKLDPMLRDLSEHGAWVSAHPDVIQKIGTKEVLFRTKHFGWGADARLYIAVQEFNAQFPTCLKSSGPRVLKQRRGNGGIGTWKVELSVSASDDPIVRVQEARRGSSLEELRLGDFMRRCEKYFSQSSCLIDQPMQRRTAEGMIRCYLVHNRVVGFSTQMPRGPGDFAMAREKTMYQDSVPRFAVLKTKMESEWVPELQKLFNIDTDSLPAIWDADFLYGPKDGRGQDTYVLGEINVSSVLPFPEIAVDKIARAVLSRMIALRKSRATSVSERIGV